MLIKSHVDAVSVLVSNDILIFKTFPLWPVWFLLFFIITPSLLNIMFFCCWCILLKHVYDVAINAPMKLFTCYWWFSFQWNVLCLNLYFFWLLLFHGYQPLQFALMNFCFTVIANWNPSLKLQVFMVNVYFVAVSALVYDNFFSVRCLMLLILVVIVISL